jgi:hypothetical protein
MFRRLVNALRGRRDREMDAIRRAFGVVGVTEEKVRIPRGNRDYVYALIRIEEREPELIVPEMDTLVGLANAAGGDVYAVLGNWMLVLFGEVVPIDVG